MAKGLRSNNKKALRTVRRQKIGENPEWLATAEAKRQEVLKRVLAGDKPAPQQDNPGTAGMEVDAQQPAQSQNISKPAKQRAKKAGGDAGKMVISTGKILLTKKKAMKLRKKQAAGNDLWKQTGPMAFHSRKSRRKGAH